MWTLWLQYIERVLRYSSCIIDKRYAETVAQSCMPSCQYKPGRIVADRQSWSI